jgi:hypothetical protein
MCVCVCVFSLYPIYKVYQVFYFQKYTFTILLLECMLHYHQIHEIAYTLDVQVVTLNTFGCSDLLLYYNNMSK